MNNLSFNNAFNVNNKEPPFHTQTTPYLPFSYLVCIALLGGVMSKIFPPSVVKQVILRLWGTSDQIHYEYFQYYADVFANSWLISADEALLYLTVCSQEHSATLWFYTHDGFLNSDYPFVYNNLWGLTCKFQPNYFWAGIFCFIFALILKWALLFSLPFIVKSFKQWLIWFFVACVVTILWQLEMKFGFSYFGCSWGKGPVTFTYTEIYNMLHYNWSLETWCKVINLIDKWHMRIEVTLLLFSFILLFSLSPLYWTFVNRHQYLLRKANSLKQSLETRPRFILVNMLISATIAPMFVGTLTYHFPSLSGLSNKLHEVVIAVFGFVFILFIVDPISLIQRASSLLASFSPRSAVNRLYEALKTKSQQHPIISRAVQGGAVFAGGYEAWRFLDYLHDNSEPVSPNGSTIVINNPPRDSLIRQRSDGAIEITSLPVARPAVYRPFPRTSITQQNQFRSPFGFQSSDGSDQE